MSDTTEFTDQTPNLDQLVLNLAVVREEADAIEAEYKAAKAAWEAEHATLLQRRESIKRRADEAYADLAGCSVKAYELNGEKKPHAAIEIKALSEFVAPEEVTARTWALANMPGLLSVNWKAYEALYLARGQNKTLDTLLETMPGQVVIVAKAYIARDLSAYLAPPAPEPEAVVK